MSDPITPVEPTTPETDSAGDSRIANVSIRGWLAVLLVVTVCGMSWMGLTVSEPLYTLATVGAGFYFGQKNSKAS